MSQPTPSPISVASDAAVDPLWLRGAVWFGMWGMLLACLSRVTVVDPDLFHELALIREAVRISHIPFSDGFAYTPTVYPVVHHEWGTGAVLYLAAISSGLGGAGLILVQHALSLFMAVGSYVTARRHGASLAVFSLLAPLAVIMAWIGFSTVRAQLFTLAFVVGLQLLLTFERGRQRWWIATWLVAYTVWLNLHAGFLVGLGLFVLHSVEGMVRESIESKSVLQGLQRKWHLLGCWVAMGLLISVNPYGSEYYRYLWRAVLLSRPSITEWSPLWRINAWELLWALIFSQVINLYVIRTRGIRSLTGLLVVFIPAILAFRHARHLSIYAVVWICYAPAWVEQTNLGRKVIRLWSERSTWVCGFWVLLGVLGITEACRSRFWEPQVPTSPIKTPYAVPIYPAGAVDYLARHHFKGNLHTPFVVGAYVSWKLSPAVRVSTDGRYEVAYPPGQVEQLEGVYRPVADWNDLLRRTKADAILVPWWSRLRKVLDDTASNKDSSNWRKVYQDDGYSIYVRAELAAGYRLEEPGDGIRGVFP